MKHAPYFVSSQYTTPYEPFAGWYFSVEDEAGETIFCGPFSSRDEAAESLDETLDELS